MCFAKTDTTQLQFIFEKCEVNKYFPLGVKMLYRAYAANSVIEIVGTEKITFKTDGGATSQIFTGYVPVRTLVFNNPPGGTHGNPESGISILTSIPYGKPQVEEFVEDHEQSMEAVMDSIRRKYSNHEHHMKDWSDW
jgi:hypothetical protein